MFSQRIAQQSLRRLAAQNPTVFRTSVSKFAAPTAVATGNYRQIRPAATSATESQDPNLILAKQRLKRPVSPHLSIYQPQITWIGSSLNRITGVALSGGLYIFALSYLVSPLLGWHLESASLATAFGALPLAAKIPLKFTLALPFTFHSFNGVRHLLWDFGKLFSIKQTIRSGFAVMGLSLASALALALI